MCGEYEICRFVLRMFGMCEGGRRHAYSFEDAAKCPQPMLQTDLETTMGFPPVGGWRDGMRAVLNC